MTTRAELLATLARRWRPRTDAYRSAYGLVHRTLFPGETVRRKWAARKAAASAIAIPRQTGFRVFAPGEIDGVDALVRDARMSLDRWITADRTAEAAKNKKRKKFLINVLEPGDDLHDASFLPFALRADILAGVSGYLGFTPVLSSIMVLTSEPSATAPTSSQLYHCDGDDLTQVKAFVLCSDVTPDSGPLTIVSAAASARIRRRVGYEYGSRLTDEQVEPGLGPGDRYELIGPAGTVCLIDTSRCLHFGSRIQPGGPRRLVTMIQYLTPFAFNLVLDPLLGRQFSDQIADLSPLQRMALRSRASADVH